MDINAPVIEQTRLHRLKSNEPMASLSLRLSEPMHGRLKNHAFLKGESVSSLIVRTIREHLGQSRSTQCRCTIAGRGNKRIPCYMTMELHQRLRHEAHLSNTSINRLVCCWLHLDYVDNALLEPREDADEGI